MPVEVLLTEACSARLNAQARAVNLVWNYCNLVQRKACRAGRRPLNAYELMKLTSGASRDINLHSHSIQRVCRIYDDFRTALGAPFLSNRKHTMCGWVPFNTGHVRFVGPGFLFRQKAYYPAASVEIPSDTPLRSGMFEQGTDGRWFIRSEVELMRVGAIEAGSPASVLLTSAALEAARQHMDRIEYLALQGRLA